MKVDAEGNPGRVQKISSRQYSKHFDWNSRICVDSKGNSYIIWQGQEESKLDHIFFTAHLPSLDVLSRLILLVMVVAMIVITGILIHRKIGQK